MNSNWINTRNLCIILKVDLKLPCTSTKNYDSDVITDKTKKTENNSNHGTNLSIMRHLYVKSIAWFSFYLRKVVCEMKIF